MTTTRIDKLQSRPYAHPFDRPVKVDGDEDTHGVGRSSNAIGGFYGMGWREAFRSHETDEVYVVVCSDGVYGGKSARSDRDEQWVMAVHRHIINRTLEARGESIVLSSHEWAIMLNFNFGCWLDPLPGEKFKTVGDANRHLDEGQIGTINSVPVIIDPTATDDLPPAGDFDGLDTSTPTRVTRTPDPAPSKFGGVFEAAFAKARSAR